MRDTLLTLHILAAGAWFGTNVVSFLVNPRINPRARAIASDDWHHFVVRIKQRYIYTPAQLIVLITGVLLVTEVEDSPFEMSDTFVLIGFFALVVAVVSGIYFARQGARVGAAYDAGDTGAAESIEQRIAMWSLASMGVILVTMWAMVSTWGV